MLRTVQDRGKLSDSKKWGSRKILTTQTKRRKIYGKARKIESMNMGLTRTTTSKTTKLSENPNQSEGGKLRR